MTQLTKNFTRAEMLVSNTATRHGISNNPESLEIEINILKSAQFMQSVRDKVEKPIRILSCYRSPRVNRLVGGSRNSAHMKGLAIDFICPGLANKELAKIIQDNFKYDQLILEFPPNGWVHVGIATATANRNQELTATKVNGKTVYNQGIA